MKKWVVFLLGMIAGGVLTFVMMLVLAIGANTSSNGMTLFDEPGECLSTGSFEIMQVIDDGVALANEIDKMRSSYNTHTELLVLLVNDEGQLYYDDKVINVPNGKCARQIGVYKYPIKSGFEKTVPIVKIME